MWRLGRAKSVRTPKAERQSPFGSRRGRLAVLLALMTLAGLVPAFLLTKGTQLLMPGALASVHGSIETCDSCHTRSGSGKLSWIHGLVAADPLADSKACLTCHKMPDTAFNAHSASTEVLQQSTKRLTKIAAGSTAPQSARAQNIAFPMHNVMSRDLYCATCHQEHQGVNFGLNKISNEQCRSCHVVQFDSFDGNHPKFENYPFERRTRTIYDHAEHFGKHFPEVAKKDPAKRIPAVCSTCHNSNSDRRIMAVAPFDQTCAACHLDQIIGKERASGPKGIAFLTLPGLDLQTLTKKNAPIGEWPDGSEAPLSPFMKILIGRNEQGRALIKTVDSLNLQDLTNASDDQIKAVTKLAWEVKGVFHALIKGKASDVLGDLNIGSGAKLSATLVADLTASIPRDAVISAQQEWLPNLATEMVNGPDTSPEELTGSNAGQATPTPTPPEPEIEAAEEIDAPDAEPEVSKETLCADEQPRAETEAPAETAAAETDAAKVEADGGGEALSAEENGEPAIEGRLPLPSGTPRAIKARVKDAEKTTPPENAAGEADAAEATPDGGKETLCAETGVQAEDATGETDAAGVEADGGNEALSAEEQPVDKATDQFDDLLFPNEEELRANKAASEGAEQAGGPQESDATSTADENTPADAQPDPDVAAADPQTQTAPVISIDSDVDPESWAEYGGWYRQDYAIFYRPTGHKDKFIYSWLFLTGPQASKGAASPAAAVFDFLISKDAQGSCAKCHSVDDIKGKGRAVNFSPTSVKSKQGRFTNFIHEPHFGILDDRGCQTCHSLEKGRPYLKSFEQGNPQNFVSNFGAAKKELCQTCHASGMARQDCLLCHKYHLNGAATPVMNTKIPAQ
jgi:hypothetical protein